MRPKRKISGEANGPVVVVISTAVSRTGEHQRETMVGVGVRLQARRGLLQQMAPQYRAASSAQKRELLNACTQITGYHRKYAMWLLNHTQEGQVATPRARPRRYGPEVQEALVLALNAANRICAKRLMPFLPMLVEALEQHGHLHLSETCREQLLTMSAATADRLLGPCHQERTSGAILRELQRLFPERYQPSHLRTLQRGLRKIRARLRETVVVQWQEEVIPGEVPDLTSPGKPEQEADKAAAPVVATALPTAGDPCQEQVREQALPPQLTTEEETHPQRTATSTVAQNAPVPGLEHPRGCQPSHPSESRTGSGQKRSAMTIERAIQGYLEEQRRGKRRPKTLEWHQTAPGLFQQYLLSECQCIFINQIMETEVRGWLTFLREIPTARGTLRSAGTMESYARSARAFCQWLVRRKYLKQTPFAHLILLNVSLPFLHLLEPEEWERLLLACRPLGGKPVVAEQAAARNQALLWVLAETGIWLLKRKEAFAVVECSPVVKRLCVATLVRECPCEDVYVPAPY